MDTVTAHRGGQGHFVSSVSTVCIYLCQFQPNPHSDCLTIFEIPMPSVYPIFELMLRNFLSFSKEEKLKVTLFDVN